MITIADEPVDAAERENCRCERDDVQRVGLSQIKNNHLAANGEKRDHHDRLYLHDAILARAATTNSVFLNSRAMITVKIVPNTAWKAE